jgi:hypothetical protein
MIKSDATITAAAYVWCPLYRLKPVMTELMQSTVIVLARFHTVIEGQSVAAEASESAELSNTSARQRGEQQRQGIPGRDMDGMDNNRGTSTGTKYARSLAPRRQSVEAEPFSKGPGPRRSRVT